MKLLRSHVAPENSLELREVFARLRDVGGSALADGQTPCCYALSKNHFLLRALEKILQLIPQGGWRRAR
jgi:hypothetical protein